MYTLQSLTEVSENASIETVITQTTVEKINEIIRVIESQRNDKSPQRGDIVNITAQNGTKYKAHLVDSDRNFHEVCTRAYIPFAHKEGVSTSVSGGHFKSTGKYEIKFISANESKLFWSFPNGSGGNMGVYFYAKVNVWEYTGDQNKFY